MSVANWNETQLGPVIGSEVTGIDLNHIDDALADHLRARLAERLVLVIRGQQLDREAHKRVARLFGTGVLHAHALNKARGGDDPVYASMYECLERLSPPIRALAEGLTALHDGASPIARSTGSSPRPGNSSAAPGTRW